MRSLTLLTCLFISAFIHAQPFVWKEITLTTSDVRAFDTYDFDNDGDLDIISSSSGFYNNIFWMENDGNGGIVAKHPIIEGVSGITTPWNVLVSDMDNDNLFDLLILHSSSRNKITYLKQNVLGDFTVSPIIYLDTVVIKEMILVDMDLDGDNDIVFVDEVKVAWIENQGGGNFSIPNLILSINDVSCIRAVDIGNDNDMDLFFGENDNSNVDLIWIENTGLNIFSAPDTIKIGTNNISDIAVGDLDGDGDFDIVTTSTSAAEVRYFKNGGTMNFTEYLVSNKFSYKVLIKDVNNDGTMDILTACANYPSGVIWYENSGTTSFTSHILSFPEIGSSPDLHFEDFNGDAVPDIIFSGSDNPGLINWRENLTGGNFSDIRKITSLSFVARESEWADIDGDGDLDAVSLSSNYIFWHENLGLGKFSNEHSLYYAGKNPSMLRKSLNVVDIDADGDLDVMASQNSSDGTVLCRNDGSGNFTIETAHTAGHYNMEMAFIDNDMLIDIIYTSIAGDKVGWKKNLGNGLYSETTIDNALNGPNEILSQDMDNDGDNDIVVTISYDNKLGWFENIGNGVFSSFQQLDINASLSSIHLNDLNGDNKVDIIAVSNAYDKLTWYENLGGGLFSPAILIDQQSSNNFYQVFSDDLDGDGDVDILTTSLHGAKYYLNSGMGFSEFEMSTVFGTPDFQGGTIRTGDFDNDGDIDVLSCANGDYNVFFYQNMFNNYSSLTVETCGSYTEPSGDSTYHASTIFYDTIPNSNGGDSALTINLIINTNTTGTDVQIACNTYNWIDGNTYTSSNNSATHTLTNTLGCDSLVTLNLSINYGTVGTDIQTACDTYNWIDGNTYSSSNSSATHTIMNTLGCDSLITLNLTIINSTTGSDIQTACDTYNWIDGNTYTVSNNTATHVLMNGEGCDSTIMLDLTINNLNTLIINVNNETLTTASQVGASYQWINCSDSSIIIGATDTMYLAVINGDYAVVATLGSCSDTSACKSVTTVGIHNIESSINNLKLYPNPTGGVFTVLLLDFVNTTITVYDVLGQEVLFQKAVSDKTVINLTNHKNGIYFVKLMTQQGSIIKRIIKQ